VAHDSILRLRRRSLRSIRCRLRSRLLPLLSSWSCLHRPSRLWPF